MTRVLVVDDEPQIRRALRAGLERNGYLVLVAAGGEEALDQAALHPSQHGIEPDPARPRYIHTEPRIGYRFRSS